MKKKTIITAFVCLIIALSSFVMFACGGDGKTSYQYYTTFFNTIKTEGSMFESGNALGVQTNYQLKNFQSKSENRSWCSEFNSRQISGYNNSLVNVSFDICNPFGMMAGDFGEFTSLPKHTSTLASNSIITAFDSLSELFDTFMSNFEIPTDGTQYTPTISENALTSYNQFYDTAIELYNNSFISFTKNVDSDLSKSAVIGLNHPYTMTFASDASLEIDFQTVIANLFGFSSKTEFINIAQNLVNTYAQHRTNIANALPTYEALDNGCFHTKNDFFVFPIAIKNSWWTPSNEVLAYVILDTNGLASIWINDIISVLKAINFNADYYLLDTITNQLYCKNMLFTTGPFVDDDQNYLILLANGLNFIEKYYPRLEKNKNTSLKSGINSMTDSFDQLLVEYQNIIDVSDKANYEIYNGNFARYKWQTKDFINNVYQSALDLGNLIYKDLDIDGTIETLNQEETQTEGDEKTPTKEEIADTFDLEFYFDYQNILILEDYRAFLMDSAIGQQLDYSLYQTVDGSLTLFTGVIGQNLKDLSAQELISYIDLCQKFASERTYTTEAITEFSCYEFVNDYDQNLDSYEKSVSGASIYKLQIEKYFGDYISRFTNFVSSNVVA